MCKAIAVNTDARLVATIAVAPYVRQLATEGGGGPPVEKYPVAGKMYTMHQLRHMLQHARTRAGEKVKTNQRRLGALFIKNAQTATPNMHLVLRCARGCAEQLAERHENWMSVMTTTDDVGGAGQQRQDAEGRRRAEQKLHKCVLEMMELPETAVLQARVHCPEHLSGMHVKQRKAVMDRARDEWEARLEAATEQRPQQMPPQVRVLADVRVARIRKDKNKSMRKTAKRAELQWHANKHVHK
jgi:hypothetical protein